MTTREELFALKEKLEEEEKNRGTEREDRIKTIKKVFFRHNGREPTQEEINSDFEYLNKVMKTIL
jgi:hypothetical protein